MPAPAHAIDAVQAPLPARLDVWPAGSTGPLTVTYAFENEQSPEFLRAYTGWTAWTADEKAAVRRALDEYESVINVRFVEVAAGPGADPVIAFGRVDVESVAETWWKRLIGPDATGQPVITRWDAGVVFDNGRDLTDPNAQWLILHEIGHAMMMKHTGGYDTTGATPALPYLPAAEDHRDYTVMSYVREDGAAVALQLQLYDIAALQARWGANTQEAAGDSVYAFDDPGIFAIWDTGGIDRIDAGAAPGAVDIDLAEGGFSQLDGQDRMSIAWGAHIENAAGGGSADRIRGNDLDNRLTGGPGADTIEGGAGLDYLRGEDGDDVIIGGAGFDDIHGNMGDDTANGGAGDDWVVGGKDRDQLFGEEGFDIVYGNLGDDTCDGGEGADWVRGGQGNDLVRGGGGADWLWGDRGDDTISGGGGADDFHVQAGSALDRVTDFSLAEGDRVVVDGQAAYTVSISGSDTVIDLGGGDRMVLVGVQLTAGSWLFAG